MKRPLAAIFVVAVSVAAAISPLASAVKTTSQQDAPPYFMETETHRYTTLPGGRQNDVFDSIARVYQDDAGKRRVEWYRNASHASGVKPTLYLIAIILPDGPRYSIDPAARTVRTFASRSDVVDADDPWFKDFDEWDSADTTPAGVESVITGEDLGDDVIFGVSVQGYRTVESYPASEDGTRSTYDVIEEHWFSDELHQDMRIEVTEPKKGRTVTTTTQFARGAQDPALFEVPTGYKVVRSEPAAE